MFSRSADYVERILKGAKPADPPMQAPSAKARGSSRRVG
jgi:hypothetical protein